SLTPFIDLMTFPLRSNVHFIMFFKNFFIEGEYLEWESEKGNAHCRGGFNYSGGGLVVPRTAIYRVFLQVTYERRKECSGQLRLSNSVFFITESYKHNVLLLSSVDTVSSSLEHWRKSLYTAGSFHLEAGGRLRVTSSHRECVVDREELLFFGAEHLLFLQHQEST
uniref:THD domain-containing protein n=1 Tax=Scophthalmus maximus TaxID=52904 RepID=A0A8D2ZDR9_SCOMX